MYRLSKPSERAEFDRKVEDWDAKCYQFTVDVADPPHAPLKGVQLDALRRQVLDWEVVEEHHLRQHFRFKNFREALDFVNKVGELAEEQGHHPDIYLGWGRVDVLVWTHKINGLTESDFIFAAKVDTL